MVVGEFTVSNIAMEEDAREEQKKKGQSTLDLDKFKADVAAQQALAKQARAAAATAVAAAADAPWRAGRQRGAGLYVLRRRRWHARKQAPAHSPAGTGSRPQGKLHEALEGLLNLEKAARQAEDIAALRAACGAVLSACFDAAEWKLLEENVVLLSKRRGQLRQVRAQACTRACRCAPPQGRPPWARRLGGRGPLRHAPVRAVIWTASRAPRAAPRAPHLRRHLPSLCLACAGHPVVCAAGDGLHRPDA